ncbi:class I SAM-dependent methyltransferase [Nostoc sp. 'Peltigera membranacea cyanobiont' N6]|uniref:class I SAM-dependent methyltransferase n=1 Tax=Nostoc sp. 'Peltigera membranacea cyanobiont' N6 TaxID=1261031 RepID=UPI000CF31EC4|nr:methyltransferase domain-containing protein [Nostoc sp. 'Peltigera membranacea cyanobiont' N6]AVH65810.1 methyltransferase [Nostoc sp. 'Peltigera membranacea cyanobiont' N6]
MDKNEQRILHSWAVNAKPWTRVIHDQLLESRALVTDRAIVEAVVQLEPRTFLDIGCGEGWLCRELFCCGFDGWGVDGIAELVESARCFGDVRFVVSSYSDIPSQKFGSINKFDCFICNFSLLGERAIGEIAEAGKSLLEDKGKIIIQTLHPLMACGDSPYSDGWRESSWQGIQLEAFDPAPWYFRTIESWILEFHLRNYQLVKLIEPCHPKTKKPVSIVFIFEQN